MNTIGSWVERMKRTIDTVPLHVLAEFIAGMQQGKRRSPFHSDADAELLRYAIERMIREDPEA